MLVCGGNNAFDTIVRISNDSTNGVHTNELLYSTFGKSLDEKVALLKNYQYYSFSDSQIDEILNELHCENPKRKYCNYIRRYGW